MWGGGKVVTLSVESLMVSVGTQVILLRKHAGHSACQLFLTFPSICSEWVEHICFV